MEENSIGAGSTSLIGAVAVVIVYWIHLLSLGLPPVNDTGISITIFLASFFAQYIPLSMEDESPLSMRDERE